MLEIRKASERGHANFGWLNSYHSFSFGHYYDAKQMGHGNLRVINQDTVQADNGFSTHSHQNMEIISYVLSGEIAHKDSEGNQFILPKGEFQLMSAGSGISHSEFNPSQSDELNFLQIWIVPNQQNTRPSYQQKAFVQSTPLTLVVSPDGEQDSLVIKQNAWLSKGELADEQSLTIKLSRSPLAYVQIISGELTVNQVKLTPGDGLKISQQTQINLSANAANTEFLLFEI